MSVDPGFRELYETEFDAVFRATYLLAHDGDTAMDATQEAFARCLERWTRLRNESWVAGWVTTTALNVARRSLRQRTDAFMPDIAQPDADTSIEVWLALRRLPRRQLEATVLHYAMDMAVAEVAAVMGCREGTVKAHLSHAREALRQHLEGERRE